MRRAVLMVVVCAWASGAAADLYRWVDPETGSVKYSSYPPPWYGDPEKERRAPKVEHLPAGYASPPAVSEPDGAGKPTAPAPSANAPAFVLSTLEARRKAIMQLLTALPQREDFARSGAGLQQHMLAYQAVAAEMDRLDPKGAAARRGEAQPLIDKLREGLRALTGGAAPAPQAPPRPQAPPAPRQRTQ
jgi:hypothetical protein